MTIPNYSNTGVRETVDGKCGFAVETGNPEVMWEAVMSFKQKGKKHFSDLCVLWVKQEFEREDNYMRYINMYKTIR